MFWCKSFIRLESESHGCLFTLVCAAGRPNQETNIDKESDLTDWNLLKSSFKTATAAC